MKLVLAISLIIMFALVAFAFAEETGGQHFYSPNGEVNQEFVDYLNNQECLNHSHQYDKEDRDNPMGVGSDITVWQNETKNIGVEVQEKYDFANEENSVYAVVKVNLWDMLKKKEVE